MKNLLTLLTMTLLLCQISYGQSPAAIPYQAIARDSNGIIIQNSSVALRISIHSTTSTGTVVYQERQTATTNNVGLVSFNIGLGTALSGTFSSINWVSGGAMFVQTEFDPSGGTSYVNMGTSQLESVPYAFYSSNTGGIPAGSAAGNTLYWNGTTWVTTSNNIYNNGGNIGIGTASPGYKLDINGNVQIQNTGTNALFVGSVSSSNYFKFQSLSGSSPEIDFFIGGSRHSVYGYDSTLKRTQFYNDNLAAGLYLYDGKGIALGTSPSTYASNAFFIEQANNKVYAGTGISMGVGTTTPNSTFADSGSVSFNVTTQTANYTVGAKDHMVVCTTNSFTVTLPTAVGITGREYIIKNGTAGKTITLATTSSQTIDGTTPGTISGIGVIRVFSNGSNWWTY